MAWLKGFDPKNPEWADRGLGCGAVSTRCRVCPCNSGTLAAFLRAWLPHRMKTLGSLRAVFVIAYSAAAPVVILAKQLQTVHLSSFAASGAGLLPPGEPVQTTEFTAARLLPSSRMRDCHRNLGRPDV